MTRERPGWAVRANAVRVEELADEDQVDWLLLGGPVARWIGHDLVWNVWTAAGFDPSFFGNERKARANGCGGSRGAVIDVGWEGDLASSHGGGRGNPAWKRRLGLAVAASATPITLEARTEVRVD